MKEKLREQRVVPVIEIDPSSSEVDSNDHGGKKKLDDETTIKERKRLDSFSSSSSFGSIRLTKKTYTRQRKRGTHRPKKSLRKKSAHSPLSRSVSVGAGDFAAALRAASATTMEDPEPVATKPRTKVVRAKKVEKAELLKALSSLDVDTASAGKASGATPKRKPTPSKDRKEGMPKPNVADASSTSIVPTTATPPSPTKQASKVLKKKRSSKELKKTADKIVSVAPTNGAVDAQVTTNRLAALFVPPEGGAAASLPAKASQSTGSSSAHSPGQVAPSPTAMIPSSSSPPQSISLFDDPTAPVPPPLPASVPKRAKVASSAASTLRKKVKKDTPTASLQTISPLLDSSSSSVASTATSSGSIHAVSAPVSITTIAAGPASSHAVSSPLSSSPPQSSGASISPTLSTTSILSTPIKKKKAAGTVVKKKKRIGRNFLHSLPLELTLVVLGCLDEVALCRVSQCSKMLHQLGGENILWRAVCHAPGFLRAGQAKPKSWSWNKYYKNIHLFRNPSPKTTYMHEKLRFIVGQNPYSIFSLKNRLSFSCHGGVATALHTDTRETVCINKIEYEEAMFSLLRENFNAVSLRLKSPYIVSQYGNYFDGNSIWHVTEFCPSGSLRQQVDAGFGLCTERELAAVCHAVLSALVTFHDAGRPHSAITASAIMLSPHAKGLTTPKLRDKSLTTLIAEWRLGPVASQSRRVYWRCPESSMTPKMDIWGLGITCLELLEGRPPHWNLPPAKARQQVVNQPPPSLLHPTQWSDAFRRFLESCLTKDPDRRPSARTLLKHPFIVDNIKSRSDMLLDRPLLPLPKESVIDGDGSSGQSGRLRAAFLASPSSSTLSNTTYYSEDEENISFMSLSLSSHISISEDFTDAGSVDLSQSESILY